MNAGPNAADGLAAFLANVGLPQFQQAREQQRFFQQQQQQQAQPDQNNQQPGQPAFNVQGNQIRLNIPLFGGIAGPQFNFVAGGIQNPNNENGPNINAGLPNVLGGLGQPGLAGLGQPNRANGPFVFPTPLNFPDPPTYAGLTDIELAQMEGQTRAAIEARLQALQNVQTLLEAATLQFQQYLTVAPALPVPQPNQAAGPGQGGGPAQPTGPFVLAPAQSGQNAGSGPSTSGLNAGAAVNVPGEPGLDGLGSELETGRTSPSDSTVSNLGSTAHLNATFDSSDTPGSSGVRISSSAR